MAQIALYRAWRPQKFAEVVGQEQIVQALRNAVEQGRISHAYLFCGPRGTGKTSVAKILAKAVNCSNQVGGEPCGQCIACDEIPRGSFMDVLEIDAASNRGIDEIRDLREKVRIMPAQGKKKVYIIDEVHMLTAEAFNALLKTLEEPPASVVFVLATTEPQKVPATIISRCQRYNFRRLTSAEIKARLHMAAGETGVGVEEEALALMANRAGGSLRDGLSILDQCLAYGEGKITSQTVQDILGLVDERFMAELFDHIFRGEVGAVLQYVARVFDEGKEARQFTAEANLYLRDLLVIKTGDEGIELGLATEDTRPMLIRQAGEIGLPALLAAMKKMMELTTELRFTESQRLLVETTFLELLQLFAPRDLSGSHKGEAAAGHRPTAGPPAGLRAQQAAGEQLPWDQVLEKVKAIKVTTHALLAPSRLLGVKDNLVLVGYKKGYQFHRERMSEKDNQKILLQVLEEMLQRSVEVEFVLLGENPENDPVVKKAMEMFGADLVEIKD
ncbi:MAG: DNA polymerase III subunit gamma/tau [Syntrophomonadaceae bacterium]|jgi:DNA polymerase-3 subunit gamma/tau|nr:DNA polymerase III subunit gamma/tau [Syntrophomonadaceae bacterium]